MITYYFGDVKSLDVSSNGIKLAIHNSGVVQNALKTKSVPTIPICYLKIRS